MNVDSASMDGPPIPRGSNRDFGALRWHDTYVHGFGFEDDPCHAGRLLLDVDYIVEWLTPTSNDTSLAFILAPATVVFDHAQDLAMNVDFTHATFQLQLDDIYRDDHLLDNGDLSGLSRWHLAGTGIDIRLVAESFEMIMRAAPRRSTSPWLRPEDRGGVRFDRTPYADGS